MTTSKPIHVIHYECIGTNGFLSKLRGLEFSETHYKNLIDALKLYRNEIKEQEIMERSAAYCLYYLEIGLSAAMKHYPKSDDEKQFIENVYIECSNLIIEIITPDFMKGPLPEKFLR